MQHQHHELIRALLMRIRELEEANELAERRYARLHERMELDYEEYRRQLEQRDQLSRH